eukprot:5264797-Pyramimonas_sp.AAC.1
MYGVRAARFQELALASAPRASIFTTLQELHGLRAAAFQRAAHPQSRIRTIQDCQGAPITLIRCVEIPGMAIWRDSGSSKRDNQTDPWRWDPGTCVLASFKIFTRLSPNGARPPAE